MFLLLGLYADVLVKHKAWDEMLQTLLVAPKTRDAHTHYEPMQLEGKYEVTNGIHGDIDYKYTITIDDSTHKVCSMEFTPARENPRNPYATLESAWQGF